MQASALADYCDRAGITPDEIRVHPELGICLTTSAVRKMCANAPNRYAAAVMNKLVDDLKRGQFQVIDGGAA